MRSTHYDARLSLLLPRRMADDVQRVAESKLTSINSYVRGAIRQQLKADKPRLEKEATAA